MHGRAVPPAGRDLFAEFAAALGGWSWDVALLQEVPPWWPTRLGVTLGAEARAVLTSRNFGLAVRRAVAVRWPDVIKSNGGGCNAILARGAGVGVHRTRRLRVWPERRWLHAVTVVANGRPLWVGNLHATVHDPAAASEEARVAASAMRAWARGGPAILGGDFNERGISLEGFVRLARHDVDYVFAVAGASGSDVAVLERGRLSDHAPLAVTVTV